MPDELDRIEAQQSMRDFAALLWAFFDGCIIEGFDRDDALELTIAHLQLLAGMGHAE